MDPERRAARTSPTARSSPGPVETSAEGTIRFTLPGAFHGRVVEGVELRFAGGEVVGGRGARRAGVPRGDARRSTTAPAASGEFAFGMNEAITEFTLNTLFDEKIGGTVHLALGRSYPVTGGTNVSALHWDLVCDLRQGGEVYADGELVYRDGRFLDARDRAPRRHAHAARRAARCPTSACACSARRRRSSTSATSPRLGARGAPRRSAPVHAVHGNMDEWPLREALPERLVVEVGGLRIGLVHDPGPRGAGGTRACARGFPAATLVAYGHTHVPEVDARRRRLDREPGEPDRAAPRAAAHDGRDRGRECPGSSML